MVARPRRISLALGLVLLAALVLPDSTAAQEVAGASAPAPPSSGGGFDGTAGIVRVPPAVSAGVVSSETAPEVPLGGQGEAPEGPAYTGPVQVDLSDDAAPGAASAVKGRTFHGPFSGLGPPDNQIAAGPDYLVVPTNRGVAYLDKGGNNLFETSLSAFWGPLDTTQSGAFDPRVIWDHYSNRFVLVAVGRSFVPEASFYYVAVSISSNPFDGWCMRRLDAQLDGSNPSDLWADFPDVGVDGAGALYLTSNQLTFSGYFYRYAKLRILDKNDFIGAGCDGGANWWDFWSLQDDDGGTSATLRASVDHGGLSSGGFIVNSNRGSGAFLTVRRITDPLNFPPTLEEVALTVASYSSPPGARQPSGVQSLSNAGPKLLNAVSYDDTLWIAGTTGCGIPVTSCIRWYQLDLSAWPVITINHQGTYGEPGVRDYFFPAIAANSSGDVVLVFARSGEDTFAEARHTGRLASDAPNTLQASALLKAGEGTYLSLDEFGRNRWGDYAGASYGANGEFWIMHQYASSFNRWGTWIGCLDLGSSTCAPFTPPPPPPAPANDDFDSTIVVPEPLPYSNNQKTFSATLQPGEPRACAAIGATVWYSYTPTADVLVTADTEGSKYDTALAVYTGAALGSLAVVGCDDDSGSGLLSRLTFTAIAGETYHFQVGGFNRSTGNLVFNLREVPPATATPTVTATPTPTVPPPVGGISLDSELRPLALGTTNPDSAPWAFAVVIAGAAGLFALGGAAWYARRRWLT